MTKGLKLSLLILVAAFIAFGIVTAVRSASDGEADAAGPAGRAELVRENSHVTSQAPDGAPVMVEFLDFECPGCASADPIVDALREEFDGRVTFVVRYFPLSIHANADDAALAAEAAAQQGQLEPMYSRMFETQASWAGQEESMAPLFRTFAAELGLDMADYDAAVTDPTTAARVQQDVDDGQALGVEGTPTFFLDGEKIQPRSLHDFQEQFESALE